MSADQVGEGAWTSISIRHSTVEQLRRSSRAGEAYDEAIARLIRDAAGRKRVVVHLGPWQWFVACLGCDWNRTVRGHEITAHAFLDEHIAGCASQ